MKPADVGTLSFEKALAELEGAVRQLEDGQLGLEESLACYERGVGLIQHCFAQLRQAEQRILVLTGVSEEGEPILQPFQHEATFAPKPEASNDGAPSSRFAREARKRKSE